MIRRWGFMVFFLLALLLTVGAWVGSYLEYLDARHYSVGSGGQAVFVGRGSMYVFAGDPGWKPQTWTYLNGNANPGWIAAYEILYRAAPYRFLGFAFDADDKHGFRGPQHLLIIPLWFPTGLSALGLLWAWRRKRKHTRRGGFEVQPTVS